jgi:hypothetical protein
MQWALQVIPSCGDQGVVGTSIAAALTRLRSSSDTGQLLPLKTATFGFVDGSVYSAALAISADASASPTARTVNLLILLMQLRPTLDVTWADLLSATLSETERCPSGLLNDLRVGVGPMPLPADATTQASTLANSVQSNASLPTMVRVAARCVVEGVRN